MKTRKQQRSPDSTTITISLKKDFRDRIEAAARAEARTRSNYIVYVLKQVLDGGACKDGPPCPAAGRGAKNGEIT